MERLFAWVFLGVGLGIFSAHLATKSKRKFRLSLLKELEPHRNKPSLKPYVLHLIKNRALWVRSISAIRKPFKKSLNRIVESAALLFALAALVNSLLHFDRLFASRLEGIVAMVFLAVVAGFVPGHWMLDGQVNAEIDGVFHALRQAAAEDRLEEYLKDVERRWEAGAP